jgi:hypothetical protein
MEFIYPPKPRPHAHVQQGGEEAEENEESAREFSPGPPWLEKMLVDLELGRKDLVTNLAEAKRDLRDALYEMTTVGILVEREQKLFMAFVNGLRSMIGDKLVNEMIAEGKKTAQESSEEGEVELEGEEQDRDSEERSSDKDSDDSDERATTGYKKS